MSDLSLWYERELSWFRKQAGQFASEHPGLARSLGVSGEAVEDPDVSRLVESVALLNARLSQQLDEELPQLTEPLFNLLFPHFLRPLPCVGMMQVKPSKNVASIQTVNAGSRFRATLDEDRHCEFRTCSSLQLLPFQVADVAVEHTPFSIPSPKPAGSPAAMLRLDIQLLDASLGFQKTGDLSFLDIYLKGELNLTQKLYDQLFSKVRGLVLFDSFGVRVRLPADSVQPVLMNPDERVLPLAGNTFPGYQLLIEYFAYQNVFLSVRIAGLKDKLARFSGNKISLGIYLEDCPVELSRSLSPENFQLGCAPVVNLYQRKGEPLKVDHTRLGYPLVIDARSANHEQVFSVDSVMDISGLKPEPLPSVYGQKYSAASRHHDCYWHYQPEGTPGAGGESHGELSLTDLNLDPMKPAPEGSWMRQLSPRLTCSNGEQPLELGLLHSLSCLESLSLPVPPKLLGKVSAPWKPEPGHAHRWALLAHLQLNFEALLGADDPAAQLRELLSLYNLTGHAGQRRCIEAIVDFKADVMVAPMKIEGRQCYMQGTEITLTLDDSRISGVSMMAFIQVLDQVLSGYAGHNSFTRLQVCLKGESGVFYQCPRRQG
ncbi:type VI secretion system baseplate subunit TssF [Parendozoicomonas sp. Alg238-R29]|uniref:type VI secretion system baseplate subunit TssF n=1 Tax=Parendozoicomonas sp. Alg238-R29 TaxID=2993446 RepID=UPI00248F08EA|nr:type VI secretion system baseplate subunit TssF [Parendozoicomonas sp. Alg238-R29]